MTITLNKVKDQILESTENFKITYYKINLMGLIMPEPVIVMYTFP